jgi:hypothetical protein
VDCRETNRVRLIASVARARRGVTVISYIIRRILVGALVVFGVVTLVFFSLQLAPGDPISMLIPAESGGGMSTEIVDAIRSAGFWWLF